MHARGAEQHPAQRHHPLLQRGQLLLPRGHRWERRRHRVKARNHVPGQELQVRPQRAPRRHEAALTAATFSDDRARLVNQDQLAA
jgi:hypothetical protein